MRLLLFTGKGGVGKTTLAAATAAHAARSGLKTLVMSADPAHSLGDALGLRLGPTPAPATPGLHAQQVDSRSATDGDWQRLQDQLVGLLDDLGMEEVAARELADLPGVDDVLALLEVRRQVTLGGWDLVLVDCGPSAETLRLLAVPELFQRALARLLPMERRIARIAATTRRAGIGAGGDRLAQAADRLGEQLSGIVTMLGSPAASVRLVMTPETVVLAETRRTWTTLGLHGVAVDGVLVNRVFAADVADPWRARWGAAHAEVLASARESFAGVPLRVVEHTDAEPVCEAALLAVAEQLYGPPGDAAAHDLLAPVERAEPFAVRRDDDGFTLSVPAPLADRADLGLGRRGDDLVVALGGRTRVIALPGALRRCTVEGARFRDGALDVRFVPDPALWRSV